MWELRAGVKLIPLCCSPLEESLKGYELFKEKKDNCVRAVFRP